jgi:hypothetical protein
MQAGPRAVKALVLAHIYGSQEGAEFQPWAVHQNVQAEIYATKAFVMENIQKG